MFYKPSQQSHRVKRIVQGNVADYGEWPWQISLMKRSKGNIHKDFSLFYEWYSDLEYGIITLTTLYS
jgi:hypothetical protein